MSLGSKLAGLFACAGCRTLREEVEASRAREGRLLDQVQELQRILSAQLDARAHATAMREGAPKPEGPEEPKKVAIPLWAHHVIGKRHAADPRLRSGLVKGQN
jgi:hypothetical protein